MRLPTLALVLVVAGLAVGAAGQQPTAPTAPGGAAPPGSPVAAVSGAYTFRTHCASCHGTAARGDGPLADSLRFRPADLTLIAKRNGGEFPTEKVVRIVDGRNPVKGHGGPEMPIWGDAFRSAESGYDDAPARAKIRLVVDYLKTLQAR